MRSLLLSFVVICFSTFSATTASAQSINKKSLVSDLDKTNGVTMNPKQKKDYENINNNLANELEEMDKKPKSQKDRDKEVDRLFDKRDNDVDAIFGNDSKYNDTKKELRKSSNSMRRKIKLTKLVL